MRRLLNHDTGWSLALHGLKAVMALFVNWMVLRHFAVADFVTWSVTSSILVVATASDLGIGQYAVTRLINAERRDWPLHVNDSLGAMLPLVLAAGIFVFVAIDGPTTAYRTTMALLLTGRIITIPFAAVLNAVNQFKLRKAIELAAYAVAAVAVGIVILTEAHVYWALLALNITFLLGATLIVVGASRFVSLRHSLMPPSPMRSIAAFRAASPFMVNNLSGLLTYGGFIWFSSLVLPQLDVAKLAVLHGFVLMNLYQLYDVFLKARQADLADPTGLAPYHRLNTLLMLVLPPAFLLGGREALALMGSPLVIGPAVTALFGIFMALELGNLFAQSITQVNLILAQKLKRYSVLRTGALGGYAIVALFPQLGENRILVLLTALSLGSLITFTYLIHGAQLRVIGMGSMFVPTSDKIDGVSKDG